MTFTGDGGTWRIMESGTFTVVSRALRELVNITPEIEDILAALPSGPGILYLFNPHTTAGLTINEGADPDVGRDIIKGLEHIVPLHLHYRHLEGNSPAHIMALLTGSSLTIPFFDNRLQLGTWQKVFFCEFDGPRTRSVSWQIQHQSLRNPEQPQGQGK